ncbi:MAPEG family protein [Rhizobium sp. YIM 134829]|uniref:MAPEG family protein n=1 Tax=Rhizobium sp. YIM 134829 TaxID=3390453 RepID=UPI00397A5A97
MQTAIFWPVIAQVLLVHALYILMLRRRIAGVRAGAASVKDFLIPSVEPAPSASVARSIMNQFELPVLFYLVTVLLFLTGGAGFLAVLLAWGFVATRYAHALVHVTVNRLFLRQKLFIAGFAIEVALWLLFAAHIL